MDLIDRQAAIDECYPVTVDGEVYEVVQVETLVGLPFAQPEIIRCKDCKHWTDVNSGLCDIWDHYISNEEFFCGCGERRENDDH